MLKVAIVAGGDSGEYDISIRSGKQVELHLDRSEFEPYLIEIRKDQWTFRKEEKVFAIDKNDFSLKIGDKKVTFDVVFNAIHGTPGENGILTGYFSMLGIPVTSCDVTTSSLTFNKSFCKKVVATYGIATAKSVHLFRRTQDPVFEIWEEISFPCFVKPNNGGSSVGMSKVNKAEELEAALEKAFHEDDEVLVEDFIRGRELTCGVLRTSAGIITFPVTEIICKTEFFDYEAKYNSGLAQEVVPAEIPADAAAECKAISAKLYDKLNCRGVVRFDYIYTNTTFYFLEVNTIPGLSEQSIVPKMAAAYGWTMKELFATLIYSAME